MIQQSIESQAAVRVPIVIAMHLFHHLEMIRNAADPIVVIDGWIIIDLRCMDPIQLLERVSKSVQAAVRRLHSAW